MAETIKKYVDQAALEHLIEKLGVREDTKDAEILKQGKAYSDFSRNKLTIRLGLLRQK
ncbi:hypothetical protein [Eubacterium ramulus]|uniref:hypothetical protein n=1 Tax=Eubacterium ramulus TaxID=39490 RepID=UPI00399A4592